MFEVPALRFGRIIYSVGSDEIAAFTGNEPTGRSAETLDSVSDVVEPVLNEEDCHIHGDYDW